MRFSYKRYIIILLIIGACLIIWNSLFRQNEKYTQTCNQLTKYQEELHDLTDRVHKLLNILELRHFLCYGSLWGQIRLSRLLPWEEKSVMCLLNEEVSSKDEGYMAKMFLSKGLLISYDSTEGQYVVVESNNKTAKMKVILILFELHRVIYMYRRIGWMRRFLPPDCELMESLDCFPPRLIMRPLPLKEFGKNLMPVPREGIEIQKYHYKNNWWKEIPVKNC